MKNEMSLEIRLLNLRYHCRDDLLYYSEANDTVWLLKLG